VRGVCAVSDLFRLITLQDPNTRVVLLGVALLSIACALVGTFAVLRRRALVADAVAHASLPGVCAAYFVVGDRSFPAFLLGALAFGLLAAGCIALLRDTTRLKEDAIIAVVLSVFFGLGIAMSRIIQNDPAGSRAGLDSFLFGKAAGMTRQDVLLVGIVALVALALVLALLKELTLLGFDRDFAASIGRPVLLLDLLLLALICLCTVIGLPAVGAILIVAMLVIPPAAARFWSDRLPVVLAVAGAFGLVSGVVGTCLSALFERVSAGPSIVLCAATLFAVSMFVAPQRGVLPALLRRHALRRRILVENLLRALHELDESREAPSPGTLALRRTWTPAQLRRAIDLARRMGYVAPSPSHAPGAPVSLTETGARRAAEVVRAHRLWELFLIDHASIAPDHVDRDADALEHLLPSDAIADLENRLREQGRLPVPLPASPHDLAAQEARGAYQ
jgi:manganese/zinc/iron transport system permease protein